MLRMASRVALLGNIAFVGCVLLRYVTFVRDPTLVSLLLITGWFAGIWFNLAVNIAVLVCWRLKRLGTVPSWLLWVNGVMCICQLCYFFI